MAGQIRGTNQFALTFKRLINMEPLATEGILLHPASGYPEGVATPDYPYWEREDILQALRYAAWLCLCQSNALVSAHARGMETLHRERAGNASRQAAPEGNTYSRGACPGVSSRRQIF